MKVKISEIFSSLQGEGTNIGKPAVFVRTAECNLACSWCDTRYTWDWKNYDYKKEVKEMTTLQIEEEIKKFKINHVVITGGEPMLQQVSLLPILASLKKNHYYVEIETNGTINPKERMIELIDQWNVSPKTSNSLNPAKKSEVPSSYRIFKNLNNAFFKFVIDTVQDIDEVENIVLKYDLPLNRIILMPQASDSNELKYKTTWIKGAATARGYSFTTRLHIELWGNKRGV